GISPDRGSSRSATNGRYLLGLSRQFRALPPVARFPLRSRLGRRRPAAARRRADRQFPTGIGVTGTIESQLIARVRRRMIQATAQIGDARAKGAPACERTELTAWDGSPSILR